MSNDGKMLERMIDRANIYYKGEGLLYAWKVPTPIVVLQSRGSRIINGFFEKAEYVDYVGVVNGGRSIAFEAKSTIDDNFAITSNLGEHQYKFLEWYHDSGAIAFLIVGFIKRNMYFIMPFEQVRKHYKLVEYGKKKSISWREFMISCKRVYLNDKIGLDYIKGVRI